MEYFYFVYAECLGLNYAHPLANGQPMTYYSGTVSRDTPITNQKEFEELRDGLVKHFDVDDSKRVLIKSLSLLNSNSGDAP